VIIKQACDKCGKVDLTGAIPESWSSEYGDKQLCPKCTVGITPTDGCVGVVIRTAKEYRRLMQDILELN
jgi:hypothetical protein